MSHFVILFTLFIYFQQRLFQHDMDSTLYILPNFNLFNLLFFPDAVARLRVLVCVIFGLYRWVQVRSCKQNSRWMYGVEWTGCLTGRMDLSDRCLVI
ncbi:hypothetical protein BDW42DRAFT_36381 [Aspergillus taichungensis]|uniref:Uncharacterized protein n=1 Tax=Aspergillus taichungensis TaxID=482145 RepID=A0A2J5I4B7_9EURO|nr:hypothetical protein BDW42DRAFT_36381 [Aspergillus taichungensis]